MIHPHHPVARLAGSGIALTSTLVGSVLVFGTVFWLINPKDGQGTAWSTGVYWAITTISTVGYGDISPKGTPQRFEAGVLMVWAIVFLVPIIVAYCLDTFRQDRDKFTDLEQEQLKRDIKAIKAKLGIEEA